MVKFCRIMFVLGGINTMAKATKHDILNSFMELVENDDFDKITVTSVVEDCNISRQTFYYHFKDIKALLKWSMDYYSSEIIKKIPITGTRRTVYAIFELPESYMRFLRKTLASTQREFMENCIISGVKNILSECARICGGLISSDEFLIKYNTYAISGILTAIAEGKLEKGGLPEKIAAHIITE